MRAARACSSCSALRELQTQTMRYPSWDGMGDSMAFHTSGGPDCRRGLRRRATSCHAGGWVCSQSRKNASSRRVRGKTVMNRPWRASMYRMVASVHSLESAT